MPSSLYWETKGHYENLYNDCFIVSQEPQGKKLIYMEKFLRHQNAESHG